MVRAGDAERLGWVVTGIVLANLRRSRSHSAYIGAPSFLSASRQAQSLLIARLCLAPTATVLFRDRMDEHQSSGVIRACVIVAV
jgi:hypothetical protein